MVGLLLDMNIRQSGKPVPQPRPPASPGSGYQLAKNRHLAQMVVGMLDQTEDIAMATAVFAIVEVAIQGCRIQTLYHVGKVPSTLQRPFHFFPPQGRN
ncbi:MAG: hypothetical protein EBZ67_07005 [Chitinophagia bacterium]|nr:hypothetical protein [Chitinophagia bacterium]